MSEVERKREGRKTKREGAGKITGGITH